LFIGDEILYTTSITSLIYNNVDTLNSPPFAKYLVASFVKTLWILTTIDKPIYWRLPIILFSLASLLVFYHISKLLLPKPFAILAVFTLAIDPLYFGFSRILNLEMPSLCLFLFSLYYFLKYKNEKKVRHILCSSFFLGLSFASKIHPLITFSSFILIESLSTLGLKKTFIVAITMLLGFTFGNAPFFYLNHSSKNFPSYISEMAQTFLTGKSAPGTWQTSPSVSWFTIPQYSKLYKVQKGSHTKTVFLTQNPLTMLLLLPCLGFALIYFRKMTTNMKIVIFAFLTIYAIYFIDIRNTYYHYVVHLLPLIILIELSVIVKLKSQIFTTKPIYAWISLCLLFFTIFYPLTTATSLPNKTIKLYEKFHLLKQNTRDTAFCNKC
jgi:4-amino-4-deoxy-L-arabinose transferase-like glycosyltransferase